MTTARVSVITPSLPRRWPLLSQAVASVQQQTILPAEHIIVMDTSGAGPGATRNKGLQAVTSEWVAFLDDDDWFYPQHLEQLLALATKREADLVYPYYDVIGGKDPFTGIEGVNWTIKQREHILENGGLPVTFLVKTKTARAAGGFPIKGNENLGFLVRILKKEAKIVHLNQRTWAWRQHAEDISAWDMTLDRPKQPKQAARRQPTMPRPVEEPRRPNISIGKWDREFL